MIDKTGFRNMLERHCPELASPDIQEGFAAIAQNRDGFISMKKLMEVMLGSLSQLRETMINEMWTKLDSDCDGSVTYNELIRRLDATNHPHVCSGRKTPVQILNEFINEFDGGSHHNGVISKEEFLTYWMTRSTAIEDDNQFADLLHRLWKQKEKPVGRNSVGKSSKNLQRSASAIVGMSTIASRTGIRVEHGRRKHLPAQQHAGNNGANLGFTGDWDKDAFRTASSKWGAAQTKGSAGSSAGTPLDRLRAAVHQRGEDNTGYQGYGRKFRIADTDRDNKLDRQEFHRLLELQGVEYTDLEEEVLWNQFDRENLGQVDFPAFLLTLRGGMNYLRKHLVDTVFDKFDMDHNGTVDIYDVRCHFKPYATGSTTTTSEYEVYKEFLIGFGDSNRDGRVTKDEFRTYYDGISSFMDKDSYFELMIRNSWHISGGTGQSANTSNLCVCVTFEDGRDEWVTLESDLGLDLRGPSAANEVIKRLKQQGLRGIVGVEWRGAV